jgi:hypothetical protein
MAAPRCGNCGGHKWTDCREFPTLGYQVADLIEATCAIPDGEHAGEPYILTDEQLRFLLWHYRIDPNVERWDARTGRGAAVRLLPRLAARPPAEVGQGPVRAAIICAEAHPEGPVLFDGWDANGEPVGRPGRRRTSRSPRSARTRSTTSSARCCR